MGIVRRVAARIADAPRRYSPLRVAGFVVAVASLAVFGIVTTDGAVAGMAAVTSLVLAAVIFLVLGTGPGPSTPAGPARDRVSVPEHPRVAPDGGSLVAVIVLTHNEGEFAEACIASVREQTGVSFECVVMDDASSDDTPALIERAIEGDPRFRVLRSDRPSGISRQRNAGVAATTAPLITFLDGDDFLYPGSLAARVDGLDGNDHPALAGVFCDWLEVSVHADTTGPTRGGRAARVTWLRGTEVEGVPFIASAPMLRREAFVAVGGFRPIPIAEDVDLWHRMLRRGFYFDSISTVGVAYRQRPKSVVHTDAIASARAIASLLGSNSRPLDGPAIGPFVFTEPYYEYPPRMMLVRRVIRAMAFALASGASVDDHMEVVADAFEPHMEWTLNLPRLISASARLAEMASREPAGVRARVERSLADHLAPFADAARAAAKEWQTTASAEDLDTGDVERSESP